MGNFRLAEHFISINGEGRAAGELALFLRFTGCNLRCGWCDTMWANEKDTPHIAVTTQELVSVAESAISQGVRNITLTGGEPLLQNDIAELIAALDMPGVRVEIETNGSVALKPFAGEHRPVFTVDYKLPSSGMERFMLTENFDVLGERDCVKFVVASHEDLERAAQVIDEYRLDRKPCALFFSPVFGRIQPAEIVDFMKERQLGGVRLQLQLHKIIWDPEKRGV
ncbi:MAG: putative 7-carboxy-7-deazaguanine synthase QueE [Ruminiclostridium sp.]|nr:putative 7-carboxy-7-deazaguanine synthase QueE [Ruminiclostridium sp.]